MSSRFAGGLFNFFLLFCFWFSPYVQPVALLQQTSTTLHIEGSFPFQRLPKAENNCSGNKKKRPEEKEKKNKLWFIPDSFSFSIPLYNTSNLQHKPSSKNTMEKKNTRQQTEREKKTLDACLEFNGYHGKWFEHTAELTLNPARVLHHHHHPHKTEPITAILPVLLMETFLTPAIHR